MPMSTPAHVKAIAMAVGPMLVPMSKGYSVEENERIRERARELLNKRYQGNRSELAAALHVSQPTLSNFLNGKSGAGTKLAKSIALHLGISHDALVEGRAVTRDGSVRYGDLEGWAEASVDARLRAFKGRLPDAAYEGAAEFRGLTVPSVIDARTVYNHAKAWWEGLTEDEQGAKLHEQALAEMAQEDAEAEDLLRRGQLKDESARR